MHGLAPRLAAVLRIMAQLPGDERPVTALSPAEARERMRKVWVGYWNQDPPVVETVSDGVVCASGRPIPVRLYDPGSDRAAPIVYFHGGGFVVGDLDTDDAIVRRLALYSGRPVISVDYRLAPEHPYPTPLDDCVTVAAAVAGNVAGLGLDGGAFALAGTSAGAHLALATALRLRDEGHPNPSACLLMMGNFDPRMQGDSYRRFARGYLLEPEEIAWGWQHYIGDRLAPPFYADPLGRDLQGLPPLYVAAAECDPLVDDSLALVARLRAAGVAHELHVWPGMIHACVAMARELNQADAQLADAAAWLARRWAGL